MAKIKILPGIRETHKDYEALEAEIKRAFKKYLFAPLVKSLALPKDTIQNAGDVSALIKALDRGAVSFKAGKFSGKFSAAVSKELKALGAKWDKKESVFKIPKSDLPYDIRAAIDTSAVRFAEKLDSLNRTLQKILPEEIADSVNASELFDLSLFNTDRKLEKQLDGITVMPKLDASQRKKIADEYATNLKKYIKDFAEDEILRLRFEVSESAYEGNRYESLIKKISSQYGVTARKAKFLARQETSLLMTKFRETRYTSAGVNEYQWQCVVGSPKHPVRPMHKSLDRKIFRWDDPPITAENGARNNPGEDFNCRCIARPIVRFKE